MPLPRLNSSASAGTSQKYSAEEEQGLASGLAATAKKLSDPNSDQTTTEGLFECKEVRVGNSIFYDGPTASDTDVNATATVTVEAAESQGSDFSSLKQLLMSTHTTQVGGKTPEVGAAADCDSASGPVFDARPSVRARSNTLFERGSKRFMKAIGANSQRKATCSQEISSTQPLAFSFTVDVKEGALIKEETLVSLLAQAKYSKMSERAAEEAKKSGKYTEKELQNLTMDWGNWEMHLAFLAGSIVEKTLLAAVVEKEKLWAAEQETTQAPKPSRKIIKDLMSKAEAEFTFSFAATSPLLGALRTFTVNELSLEESEQALKELEAEVEVQLAKEENNSFLRADEIREKAIELARSYSLA